MLCSISKVSSGVVCSTTTFWNLLSSAPSFSILFLYSSRVVAPIHCMSPRDSAGLSMFAASMLPGALPAPTIVCISSMKMIISGLAFSSLRIDRILSSNCPRYFVPATTDVISRATTRLPNRILETFFSAILIARPSTMALFPTPGSPISTGLFFLRLLSICASLSISFSRPTTGSNFPSMAARVMSNPKLSMTGVSLPCDVFCFTPCACLLFPVPELFAGMLSSSSSSSSS